MGLIERIHCEEHRLPSKPYLRARLVIDVTKPLIPDCFLPLDEQRVSWVDFRYEGIFKFCKECGCVGHNIGKCPLSSYEAQRLIQRRMSYFENHGMNILHTQDGTPLYTNLIRSLVSHFIHTNPRINLHLSTFFNHIYSTQVQTLISFPTSMGLNK